MRLQLRGQRVRALLTGDQGDVAVNALALDVVRIADHRRLGDERMGNEGAFHLGGAEPVARDVEHVVHPAGDPVIAVLVAAAAVAGEIFAAIGAEIGLHEAVMIAIDGPHLPGPGAGEAEIARGRALQHLAVGIDQLWPYAEKGPARGARLHAVRTGQSGDHRPTGLGLPPGVDDRAFLLADRAPIPEPGLRIDRLADRAEQADRGPVVLLHRAFALAHQGADRGGGGVEDVDLEPLDHLPEAREIGVVRHALEHQRRRAVQ